MIGKRNEWCLSRQRKWGASICLWRNRLTGELHEQSSEIIQEITKKSKKFECIKRSEFADLSISIDESTYELVEDVMDVWFDSACVISSQLDKQQADLIIEGRDQYRGWFQHSLIVSFIAEVSSFDNNSFSL